MGSATWQDAYRGELQSLYLPIALPTIFLAYLLLVGKRRSQEAPSAPLIDDATSSFMRGWAIAFAVETILDPLATGPLTRWLELGESLAANLILFTFVVLGDLRVFLLVFHLARPRRALLTTIGESAAWSLIVPAVAWSTHRALVASLGDLPSQTLWLIYEIAFVGMALLLALRVLPTRVRTPRLDYLLAITRYVGLYYALWATSDILILARVDAGWGLRIVPNQLYYALFVPVAYVLFFSRRYASTSTSTQALR